MNSFWIFLFTTASFCSVVKCVYIKGNGYRDVIISFSENALKQPIFDFLKLKDILTNASDILLYATRKRSFFQDFLFVLPPTWKEKSGFCDEFTEKAPKNIDIYVTDSSTISVLTAQHSKGCGEKGETIYLPRDWMKGTTQELAMQFVQQWSIFRYGVFSENPEKPGSCIASIDSTWSPTGCYNVDLNMEVQFDENGLPLCYLPNDFDEQEGLNSSIMFTAANSSKILNFCDAEAFPHNPIAPTLHNRICDGKSVWSVIENTEDFKYRRNSPVKDTNSPIKPTFRCFKESKTHLTIMIQDIDSEARSEIRYSLFYFLSILEPADFAVSLGTFSSYANTDDSKFVNITLKDKENLKSLLNSLVKLNEEMPDACLTCGLRKAYKVSETSQYSFRTIVLIARESSLENLKVSEMAEIMQEDENVLLHLLLLEDTETDIIGSTLIEVMQNNRGRIFRLKNEPVFMLSELTTALLDASKSILHIEDKILVVHKKTYLNVTSDFNDTFSVPKKTKGKLLYSMQFKNRGDIKNVNDKCTDEDDTLQSPICGNKWDLNYEEASSKVWDYSYRYDGGSKGTTCSSLALLKLDSSPKNSFTVKGWLSENKIIPGQNALVIYAEIYNRLDQHVKVEARISGPELDDFQLELRDNGNGDPDIMKGDNIYSRYFTSFSQKGLYTVSIVVEVGIKEKSTNNDVKVIQTKVIGSFRVIQTPPKEDILPPNRVCDLKILSVNSTSRTFSIQWTAPGDDYDYGKANEYKIYFTEDWKNLDEEMLNKIPTKTFDTNEIEPKMNGKQELEMFTLPKASSTKIYFMALKSIDKNGNGGKISNIIQAAILINNITQYNNTENNTEPVTNYQKNDAGLIYINIYIVSGVVIGIIFLIIVINNLIWTFRFRKYKKSLKSTKLECEHVGKRGNNINSDENILQSENESNQIKIYNQNQETLSENTDTSNPILIYSKVQKRGKNHESSITYANENFKKREVSHQKESDLGFV